MGRLLLLLINTRWSVLSIKAKLFVLERERNYCRSWELVVTSLFTKWFLQQHPTEVAVLWAQKGGVLPLLPQCLIYSVAESQEQEGSGDAVHSCMKYRPFCKQASSPWGDSHSGPGDCPAGRVQGSDVTESLGRGFPKSSSAPWACLPTPPHSSLLVVLPPFSGFTHHPPRPLSVFTSRAVLLGHEMCSQINYRAVCNVPLQPCSYGHKTLGFSLALGQ